MANLFLKTRIMAALLVSLVFFSTMVAANDVIRVAVVPCTCFAPFYIADAKGYFRDAGITVEKTQVAAGQDAVAFLANGQLDALFGGVSAGLFNALQRGLDVKLVASMGGESIDPDAVPPVPLVIRMDLYNSGVRQASALKGLRVAVPGGLGSTGSFDLAVQLERVGLALRDVNIINLTMPDTIQALKNRAVDAAITTNPFLSSILKDNLAVVGAPSIASILGRPIAKTGLFFNPTFIAEHHDAVARFVNALTRASQDLQDPRYADPTNLEILSRATGMNAEMLMSARFYFSPLLEPSFVGLAEMQQVFVREGILKQAADLSNVVAQF